MVDMTVRLRYAGKMGPVLVKQMTQEDSGAHPEHTGVQGRAGGSMETLVVGHSSHGGASDVDGGVSVTAVDEMIKQQGIKHHDIMAKLKQDFARAAAHRRATTTVKRTRL